MISKHYAVAASILHDVKTENVSSGIPFLGFYFSSKYRHYIKLALSYLRLQVLWNKYDYNSSIDS